MNNSSLHHAIINGFLTNQRSPTVAELAATFGATVEQTREALRALGEYHGVVLHPHSDEVWVAHPFSAAPTTCVVKAPAKEAADGGANGAGTKAKTWWGNCAWCSLGVAHLAGGTATIETRLGAIGDAITISIVDGELIQTDSSSSNSSSSSSSPITSDLVVHFPIPMKKCWDNVIHTCSVMCYFRNEAEVDAWCAERGVPKGDVVPIQQVWHFAKEWYGRHADADWTKWSLKEACDIFARHSLTSATWSLASDGGRF